MALMGLLIHRMKEDPSPIIDYDLEQKKCIY